jgi:predicted ATPase
MIDDIKIENFRGFSTLSLSGLKRLNLIVGENNAGKTSLLEAIVLLSDPRKANELPNKFRPVQGNAELRYFRWLMRDGANHQLPTLECNFDKKRDWVLFNENGNNLANVPAKYLGKPIAAVYSTGRFAFLASVGRPALVCKSISVFQQQTDHRALVALVGRAQRKGDGEEQLQRLLAKVDPRIKKIRVDPAPEDQGGNQVIVDIGLSELIPITQAGQGVNRLMSILADIIGESPDVLLIDEIENGLHHSAQEQIWTGLAEAAEKLNVQIFATTHSNECLLAANAAFQKRPNYDFSVIQLFRVKSGPQGRVLGKEQIEAAIAGDIDLR